MTQIPDSPYIREAQLSGYPLEEDSIDEDMEYVPGWWMSVGGENG